MPACFFHNHLLHHGGSIAGHIVLLQERGSQDWFIGFQHGKGQHCTVRLKKTFNPAVFIFAKQIAQRGIATHLHFADYSQHLKHIVEIYFKIDLICIADSFFKVVAEYGIIFTKHMYGAKEKRRFIEPVTTDLP